MVLLPPWSFVPDPPVEIYLPVRHKVPTIFVYKRLKLVKFATTPRPFTPISGANLGQFRNVPGKPSCEGLQVSGVVKDVFFCDTFYFLETSPVLLLMVVDHLPSIKTTTSMWRKSPCFGLFTSTSIPSGSVYFFKNVYSPHGQTKTQPSPVM